MSSIDCPSLFSNYRSTNFGGGCASPAWTPAPPTETAQTGTIVSGDVLNGPVLLKKTARVIQKFFALIPISAFPKNRPRTLPHGGLPDSNMTYAISDSDVLRLSALPECRGTLDSADASR